MNYINTYSWAITNRPWRHENCIHRINFKELIIEFKKTELDFQVHTFNKMIVNTIIYLRLYLKQ